MASLLIYSRASAGGALRIARLGPGGPSPRAGLRLALRPRDGLRRALRRLRFAEGTLEPGQRAHDGVTLDGERDADVAGHPEAGAGDGQHALLGQQADEGHVVVDGGPREHVERALRLHAAVPDARQPLVHEVALLAIGRDVDHLIT